MFGLFNITPEVISWVEGFIVVLTAISGVIGKLYYSQRKTGKELVKVINEAPLENKDFLEIAEKAGLKGAIRFLSKLLK